LLGFLFAAQKVNNMNTSTTCCKCGRPLSDNDLVKKAYTLNTTAAWAKSQLKILSDMADDHKLPDWVSRHARKIMDGIMLLS
jgi:hypothetical protein